MFAFHNQSSDPLEKGIWFNDLHVLYMIITIVILQKVYNYLTRNSYYLMYIYNAFLLPDYTLVFDLAHRNNYGGVALYVHNSFTFSRHPFKFMRASILKYLIRNLNLTKFITGNIYRRPSVMAEYLLTIISEYSGDCNIDMLKNHMNSTFNTFFV